jgi:hypothetical protein
MNWTRYWPIWTRQKKTADSADEKAERGIKAIKIYWRK